MGDASLLDSRVRIFGRQGRLELLSTPKGVKEYHCSPDNMPIPLSRKSRRLSELLFTEPRLSQIRERLIGEAAENIPFYEKSNPADMDRIRFSIMKLSLKAEEEDSAFELAKQDWRDLFMSANFSAEDAHEKWFRSVLPEEEKQTDFSEIEWWAFWRK